MKVLFLIEGWISPAPRYRVLQYLSYLDAQGIDYEVRALHGHAYPFFYHWPVLGALYKGMIRFSRRLYHLRDAHRYDVVFQQRLSLPFSSLLERLLARRNPKLIFDFDDAIFQTEAGPDERRMRVFREVLEVSRKVIAGSDYLATCSGREATVIPTVIDTDQYLPRQQAHNGAQVTIGWMGTASNYPNFTPLLPVLERLLASNPGVRLEIVSDREPPFTLKGMHFTRWSKDTEVALLQSFDVGIMPLADNDWNRGKCAFKLIQYMSVGIPVVAGDVGANGEVVLEGETGFLASDAAAWATALTRLLEDASMRARLGAAGRQRCEAHYSIKSAREQLVAVLRHTARTEA